MLQDNGGNDLSVGASGGFTFSTGLATGAAYSVTVKTSPAGQTCTVANGSGTVSSANVTNVAVTCSSNASGIATDTFTRANGALGSNRTTVAGTAAPQIVSNTARPGTASKVNSAYWSATTFGNDQFAQASMPASSASQFGPGVAVRLSSSKGYFLWYGNSPNTVSLWRMDSASSWTELKASGALTVKLSSDVWKIQAVGSTISGYQNGNLVVQATDTKITSGSPGIWLYYAANQISNWSGGDVTTASTYSIGGTVSGLSGTVVLQDNGGDDLSVGASGGFTFGTGLATGAAYSVTVKTSPAGQTCTVANGSGTVGSANVTNVAVTCAAASTYSIGGTVSGLSGTVVLQDNGADNISVSANGAFTFPPLLVPRERLQRHRADQPFRPELLGIRRVRSGHFRQCDRGLGHVRGRAGRRFGRGRIGQLHPGQRQPRPELDGYDRWGPGHRQLRCRGTNSSGDTGDIRTGESYGSNQFSQVQLTSTQLTGGQWVGPAVRSQAGGQDGYVGIYYWDNGSPEMMLFLRDNGNWTQLGSYSTSPLAAGAQVRLTVVGSTLWPYR